MDEIKQYLYSQVVWNLIWQTFQTGIFKKNFFKCRPLVDLIAQIQEKYEYTNSIKQYENKV